MTEEHYWITCTNLPLAIYREVATHLQQVPGVDAEVLPQTSTQFDYLQSQAGGLHYCLNAIADNQTRRRVSEILQYYGDRFAPWQPLSQPT